LYGHERIAIKKKTTFLPPISFKNFLTGDLLSYLIQDEVNPLIFVHYDELKPITVGLFYFVGDEYTYWNRMSAAGIYAVIPSLLFFLLAQKYIVRGLTSGALKY
jgi:ABC-type maltose transport system permease subunit